jgi:hypothetical protein
MPLILDNTTEVVNQLETTVTTTTRTVTAVDSTPVGAAGVDTRHASFITFGIRNFVSATATFLVWGLVGNEWSKLQKGVGFSASGPKLIGPLEIRGADRVFLQAATFTGTSLDTAYLVHNPVPPSTLEDRPETYSLDNASSAAIATQDGFQVFVPYSSNSLGEAVENDVGLNTVLTVEEEDTGQDGNDVQTAFSLTAVNTPIVSGFAGMVTVIATISSSEETLTDDGAGNLSGSAGTGTVTSYAAGTLSVTFSSPPDNLTDILITYTYDV